MKKIKTGIFDRGLRLAKLTASAGTKFASHKLNELVSSKLGDSALQRLLLEQIAALTKELGQLKGSVMKVGQMLSMYGEHFLPPEANSILKSLQFQSPPLEWTAIEKLLFAELGAERMAQLEFDTNPLASASLGQVHRARIRATGDEVAVKIQYPGVERAIDSDLRALRGIFKVAELLPQVPHLDYLFEEVRSMLHQELDYTLGLENTEKYRQAVGDDPRYIIPRTYSEFSTGKILTTEYVAGSPLDSAEVQGLPQERRNALAFSALDLYFRELFEFAVVQTDPHLGNYRIRIDENDRDQLVLFDFGALRFLPDSFLRKYYELIRAAYKQDIGELEQAALELGFIAPGDAEDLRRIFCEFCLLMVEPFVYPVVTPEASGFFGSAGEYDWRKSDLPKRLTQKVGQVISSFRLRAPPQEVVFLDRKTGGVFILLSVLGARINGQTLLHRYLEQKR